MWLWVPDGIHQTDRVSRFGANQPAHYLSRSTLNLLSWETRFSSQGMPRPDDPPEQPGYLGRDLWSYQIEPEPCSGPARTDPCH